MDAKRVLRLRHWKLGTFFSTNRVNLSRQFKLHNKVCKKFLCSSFVDMTNSVDVNVNTVWNKMSLLQSSESKIMCMPNCISWPFSKKTLNKIKQHTTWDVDVWEVAWGWILEHNCMIALFFLLIKSFWTSLQPANPAETISERVLKI